LGSAAFARFVNDFPIQRPIEPITAQMSLRYSVAVALLDGAALIKQFANARIESDDVWNLIDKTHVHKVAEFDQEPHTPYTTQVTIVFTDGSQKRHMVETPTGGAGHPLSNEAIVAKFNTLTSGVAAKDRIGKLQDFLLNIEKQKKAVALLDLLEAEVTNALA
jgi:aconitate decarboxylase